MIGLVCGDLCGMRGPNDPKKKAELNESGKNKSSESEDALNITVAAMVIIEEDQVRTLELAVTNLEILQYIALSKQLKGIRKNKRQVLHISAPRFYPTTDGHINAKPGIETSAYTVNFNLSTTPTESSSYVSYTNGYIPTTTTEPSN